tara:strand:+ start:947 stop:1243 length:297 start_codon:yes stop_codon:yes gene_type:complete
MDWRVFTKQNYIKDLPLMEQKRRYMKALNEAEEEFALAVMAQSQANQAVAVMSQTGAAVGGPDPLDVALTAEFEFQLQESTAVLVMQQDRGVKLVTNP